MKKWLWLALLVLVVAVVVGNSGFFVGAKHSPSDIVNYPANELPAKVEKSPAAAKPVITTPEVSADELFAHINKLNFKRYTSAERSRTRTYITTSLQKLGWTPTLEPFEGGVNVFAQRQGTNPEAGAILVAAHYDTVAASPGADDNATGVAVVLEVARLLGSRPTPRTLQLAFFDQEELGLLGSKAFVANKAHLENLQGAIVMDMVGYACYTSGCQNYPAGLPVAPPTDKGDFLAAVGDAEHLPLLAAFQNPNQASLPPVLTVPIPLKGLLTPDTLRSDHAPFWYQGIGAVLLTDTANLRTPHYHQPSDIPANLDRPFFTGAAQIIVNATTALLESSDRTDSQPATPIQ